MFLLTGVAVGGAAAALCRSVEERIRAASVNGFDLAVAAGLTKDYMEHRFPVVLGKDFAGEVDLWIVQGVLAAVFLRV